MARGRNFGARQARGDVIVYADAHLRLEPDWWRPLVEALENPKVGGVAPAISGYRPGPIGYGLTFKDSRLEVRWQRQKPRGPVAAPIIPGCCFATRRDVIEATGGWDDSQLQRGNIDNEGCVRFWMLGYDLMITPNTIVAHKFRKRSPYHVGWPEFLFNRLRLAFVHFNARRLGKVVAGLRNYPGFGEALGAHPEIVGRGLQPADTRADESGDVCGMTTGIANGLICLGSPQGQIATTRENRAWPRRNPLKRRSKKPPRNR